MAKRENQPHTRCKLEEIRNANEESLEALSEAVGMSASCLHKLQKGRDPKFLMALKIARHYQKPLTEIWPDAKTLFKEVPCQRAEPNQKSKSVNRTAEKSKTKKAST